MTLIAKGTMTMTMYTKIKLAAGVAVVVMVAIGMSAVVGQVPVSGRAPVAPATSPTATDARMDGNQAAGLDPANSQMKTLNLVRTLPDGMTLYIRIDPSATRPAATRPTDRTHDDLHILLPMTALPDHGLPEGWQQQEFNGQKYYLIPLSPDAPGRPVTRPATTNPAKDAAP